jgi:hypothetical protein
MEARPKQFDNKKAILLRSGVTPLFRDGVRYFSPANVVWGCRQGHSETRNKGLAGSVCLGNIFEKQGSAFGG